MDPRELAELKPITGSILLENIGAIVAAMRVRVAMVGAPHVIVVPADPRIYNLLY